MCHKRVSVSYVLGSQKLGIKEAEEGTWTVSFMHYEIGCFDLDACRVEPVDNPFGSKVLTMCSL